MSSRPTYVQTSPGSLVVYLIRIFIAWYKKNIRGIHTQNKYYQIPQLLCLMPLVHRNFLPKIVLNLFDTIQFCQNAIQTVNNLCKRLDSHR